MDITKSDIVISRNGRDAGKPFFVLEVNEEFVKIANGKGRRIERPKIKKLKHVEFVSKSDCRAAEKIRNGDKVTNSDLRKALAQHTASDEVDQGGM